MITDTYPEGSGVMTMWNGEQPPPEPSGVGTVSPPGWPVVMVFLVVIGVIVAALGFFTRDDDVSTGSGSSSGDRNVVILVSGDVATAGYTIQAGSYSEQATADVPLVDDKGLEGRTFTLQPGDFVYVSAQLQTDYGHLECQITSNGVTVSTGRASGGYGIATCSGTA